MDFDRLHNFQEMIPKSNISRHKIIPISAGDAERLQTTFHRLIAFLSDNPQANLDDLSRICQLDASNQPERAVLICKDTREVLQTLKGERPAGIMRGKCSEPSSLSMILGGVINRIPRIAYDLYNHEATFRYYVDYACDTVYSHLGLDFKEALGIGSMPERSAEAAALSPVGGSCNGMNLRSLRRETISVDDGADLSNRLGVDVLHPAAFIFTYAMAQMWIAYGCRPDSTIGYSMGEYISACLAGVINFEDAVLFIVRRSQLFCQAPKGGTLAVMLSSEDIAPYLSDGISLAAVNSPASTSISGLPTAIARVQKEFKQRRIAHLPIDMTIPYHSDLLIPMREGLESLLNSLDLRAPARPYISCLAGDWIQPDEASSPQHYSSMMCEPVRFDSALSTILENPNLVLLEVSMAANLSTHALHQTRNLMQGQSILNPFRTGTYNRDDVSSAVLETVAKLWVMGVDVNWQTQT